MRKNSMSKKNISLVRKFNICFFCFFSVLLCGTGQSEPSSNTLPGGGQITHGQGVISQSGNTLTVDQQSNRLITNWNSFDVGANAAVRFNQPGSNSAALNRILDSKPSQIFGQISSNGHVYLINPNGILFGGTAQVNVGALVASSLDLTNEDFLNENFMFQQAESIGHITNDGRIITADGGVIAFIGGTIENNGTLRADGGSIALAAGDKVNIDFVGDGLISIEVDSSSLKGSVTNTGNLSAEAGMIVLSADAADRALAGVVNNSGIVEANSLVKRDGKIILEAGYVDNSGTLDVSSESVAGGKIVATGDRVMIDSGSSLEATGATGGGEIYVGGGWQGGDPDIYEATGVYVDADAVLDASATDNGDGGTVVVWSDVSNEASTTVVKGEIFAKAGANGGDGGRIETSGYNLETVGSFVSAGAPQGKGGLWLLDPADATINQATADGYVATLNGGSSVTNTVAGDITLSNGVTIGKSAGGDATLTFKASGNIILEQNSEISSSSGALNTILWADSDATDGGYINLYVSTIDTNGGDISLVGGVDGNGYAEGTSVQTVNPPHQDGISITNSTLDSGGGTITMKGKGYAGNLTLHGGGLWTGSGSIDTGGGDLVMDVQAQENGGATEGGIRYGAYLDGTPISTGGGNVQISTASPNTTWKGLYINPGTTIAAGAGDITLSTDQISIGAAISGSGALTIQPITSDTTVGLAGGSGTLNLSTTEIGYFQDGFSSITIGKADAGAITVGGADTIYDDLNLISNSTIALNGALTINDNLAMTSGGAITQTQALDVNGTTTITAGSSNNITLTNTSNDFTGEFSVVSGAAVSVKDVNSVTLGDINMSADLSAEALNGNLLLDGDILKDSGADATATLKATGYVTLADSTYIGSNNAGAANGITSSIISTNNKLHVVLNPDSGGGGGGFWLPVGSSITTNGGDVTIGGGVAAASAAVGNTTLSYENNALYRGATINGTITAGGGDIVIKGSGAPAASAARGVSIGGSVSTTGSGTINITGTGDGVSDGIALGDGSVGVNGSLSSEDGTITLDGTKDTNRGVNISTASSSITTTGTGNLSITSSGDMNATGTLDINGTTSLTAGTDDITFENVSNDFSGEFGVVSGAVISVKDTNSITLGDINVSGDLSAEALSGNLLLDGDIVKDSGADATATLKATGYITLADSTYIGSYTQDHADGITSSISSSNNKLNVIVNPGSGGGEGGFWLPSGSSITTNGGDITVGGGADPTTTMAIGYNSQSHEWNSLMRGVAINGTLNAQGGDIILNGRGSTNAGVSAARGVHIGGSVSTSGAGTITIKGQGDGGSSGVALGDSTGFNGTISSEDGLISITGTKDTGDAINVSTASSSITTTGTGNLALVSNGGDINETGTLDINGTTSLTAGTDDISLTNASNDFAGAVTVVSGADVSITDANDLDLGTIGATGDQVYTSGLDLDWTQSCTYSSASAITLTLQAARDILVQDYIETNNGDLSIVLTADSDSNSTGGVVVKDNLTTGGGDITFNGLGTIFNGGDTQYLTTGGGNIDFNGEVIIANTSGLQISTSNGNVTFDSSIDSGNTYEYDSTARTWEDALALYNDDGSQAGDSYLATVTSELEMTAVLAEAEGNVAWLGGSDNDTEGTWRWVVGPEGEEDGGNGRIFWVEGQQAQGDTGYVGYNNEYVNWNGGEPNDSGSNEDALQMGAGAGLLWNDEPVNGVTHGSMKEIILGASPLTINAVSGTVTFSGNVGSNKALDALTVTGATIAVNGGGVTTEGLQTYNNNISLGSATTTLEQTDASMDFTLQSGKTITNSYGNNADLTIKTTGAIILDTGSSITSSTGALDTVLWADTDANGGVIDIKSGSSVNTNGGHLWLGGGDGSTTWNGLTVGDGYALQDSNASYRSGIRVTDSTLQTGGGNLQISGKGYDGNHASGYNQGVIFDGSGATLTVSTGAGNVSIEGIAQGDGNAHGVDLGLNSGDTIQTTSGSIQITGTGSADTDTWTNGIILWGGDVYSSDGGDITFTGTSGGRVTTTDGAAGLFISNANVLANTGTVTLQGTQTGFGNAGYKYDIMLDGSAYIGSKTGAAIETSSSNLDLIANTLNIHANSRLQSSGVLTVKPRSAVTSIGIAGGAGTLSLTADNFSTNFVDGFSGITVGRSDSDTITVGGSTTFNDSTTLLNDSTIAINGAITASENLALISGGTINQTQALDVNGTTSITAGSGNSVFLNNANNDFTGAVSVVSGNVVSLYDTNALVLGAGNISNSLTLQSNGDITQTGALSVADATGITSGTGDVVLTNVGNDFQGTVYSSSGAGSISITDTNDMDLGSFENFTGDLAFTAGGDLTLLGNSNKSSGDDATITFKADGAIIQSNGVNLWSTNNKINMVYWADADGAGGGYVQLNESASISTNGGHLWIGGGSGSTTWNSLTVGDGYAQGNNGQGTGVYISNGAINTAGGDVAIYGKTAVNGLTNPNSENPEGTAWASGIYTVYEDNKNVSINSGTGTILLDGVNVLTQNYGGDAVYLNGGTLTSAATSGNAITINGDSSAANYGAGTRGAGVTLIGWNDTQPIDISATGGGDIVITGVSTSQASQYNSGIRVVSATNGTTAITTLNGGDITLNSTNNDLTATYSIGIETAADTISSSGNLNIVSNTGSVTFAGAVDVDGTTSFTASSAGNITAANASNDFTGAVTVVSGQNISLVDSNAMTIAGVTSTGTVESATLTGDLTVSGDITTTNTSSSAIVLNAGKNTAAGTASGGDIILSGDPTISKGVGGRATLFTGSVSGSTGVTDHVVSGSGKFRYNSDETATNYTTALSSGTYAIYREQPTITVTASDETVTYDASAYSGGNGYTSSGYQNGDTNAVLTGVVSYGGDSQGAEDAGTYTITASNLANGLGYGIDFSNGTLTVNKAAITIATSNVSKTYDATTNALGSAIVTVGSLYGTDSISGGTFTFDNKNVGTNKTVTTSGVTVNDGNGGNNYTVTYANNTSSTITQKALTISGSSAANKVYDTNTNATVTVGSLSGVIGGDTVTVSGTGVFDDKNVGTDKDVATTYALAGTDGGNYSLAGETLQADVTQKALTISGSSAANKVYDANTTATVTAGSLSGVIGGDTVTVSGTGNFDDKNVGTDKDVATTYALAGTDGGNYSLAGETLQADVTQKALTISGSSAANKVYDANTTATVTAGSLSGVIGGDTVTVSGTGTFDDKNVGTDKDVATTYALAGTDGGNYSLAGETLQADVTQKALTISGSSAANKVYDANTTATVTAGSLSGVIGGDTVTVSGTGTFDDKNVGTDKDVATTYALAGTDGGNYSLAGETLQADVTQKTLTISGSSAANKVYDANTTATVTAGSLSGVIGGDTVTVSGTGTFDDKNVGTDKDVATTYALAGTDGGNYSLAGETLQADVTQKALTISGSSAANKVYDANTTATVTAGSLSGVIGGDTVTVSGTGVFDDKNVGTDKDVATTYALAGTDGGNYSLAGETLQADVTQKALTISGSSAANKVYDANTTATVTAGSLSGVIGGDTVTVSGTGVFDDKNVGTDKDVATTYALAGTDGGNYSLAGETLQADVTQKALTISGSSAANKIYDANTTATVTAGSLSGVIGGDTVTVSGTGTFDDKNVGTDKDVATTYALAGTDGGNYSLAGEILQADVTQKALTISGSSAANKVYDANTTATVTAGSLSGVIDGDTVTVSGTGTFDDKNVGTDKDVATTYALAGTDGGNYSLEGQILHATISQKAITVINMAADDKIYDGSLTASLSGGELSGVVAGDDVSFGNHSGVFADKNVDSDIDVTVSGTTLSGGDATNYSVSDPTGLSADISKRPIDIDAEPKSKIEGQVDPSLTYTVGGMGLVEGDSLSGGLTREVGEAPGEYEILQGTLANDNYEITYNSDKLTIAVSDVVEVKPTPADDTVNGADGVSADADTSNEVPDNNDSTDLSSDNLIDLSDNGSSVIDIPDSSPDGTVPPAQDSAPAQDSTPTQDSSPAASPENTAPSDGVNEGNNEGAEPSREEGGVPENTGDSPEQSSGDIIELDENGTANVVGFEQTGDTITMEVVSADVGSNDDNTPSSSVPETVDSEITLLSDSGEGIAVIGTAEVVDTGNSVSLTSSDQVLPSIPEVGQATDATTSVDFQLPDQSETSITVTVTSNDVLVVNVKPEMITVYDENKIALLGIKIAKEKLKFDTSKLKGVLVQQD